MLFAGIDGGQSSSVAVVGDERRILGRGAGPAADLVGETRTSLRQRRALDAALDAALDDAGIARATRMSALVAGISGFDDGISLAPDVAMRSDRVRIVHDTVIAHAGALGGAAGIVVIAGTGSVALGNDAASPDFVRAGGWGYFFGDEGSALWIARTALRTAMRREDGGGDGVLGARAREFFAIPSLRALQHAFAHGDVDRARMAAFARDVLACARADDADACEVRDDATRALVELCRIVDARLPARDERRVAYIGGVFEDRALCASFESAMAAAVPHARVSAQIDDAATGALVLARSLR